MSDPQVAWPQDVVRHAIARDLLLVIGAGVSRSCAPISGRRPPPWDALILDAVDFLHLDARAGEIRMLVAKERLLDAAELLHREAQRTSQGQDLQNYIRNTVDGAAPGALYQGSPWHAALARMEPSTIVTTNYDKIIERATASGYTTHTYLSTGFAADIRAGQATLLKIHGSTDDIENIILTRTDYTRLRLAGRHSLEVLQALLLTRTALFVGYGLRDPDMQLLLENTFGGRGLTPAHYLLTGDDTPDYERDALRFSYGVTTVTYPAGRHDIGLAGLEALADEVQARPLTY